MKNISVSLFAFAAKEAGYVLPLRGVGTQEVNVLAQLSLPQAFSSCRLQPLLLLLFAGKGGGGGERAGRGAEGSPKSHVPSSSCLLLDCMFGVVPGGNLFCFRSTKALYFNSHFFVHFQRFFFFQKASLAPKSRTRRESSPGFPCAL